MKNFSRRKFIRTATTSIATAFAAPAIIRADDARGINKNDTAAKTPPPPAENQRNISEPEVITPQVKLVPLGNSGLQVSQIAFGTGTVAINKQSHQTKLGFEKFTELARYGYSRGLRVFDMADTYGSHEYVKHTLKTLPRDKVILSTKLWTHGNNVKNPDDVGANLQRILGEIGVKQLDVFILHCMMRGDWTKAMSGVIEGMQKARNDGLTRALGVSCHNWDALNIAVETPWVQVIFARINPFGEAMDNKPELVAPLLKKATDAGKGVIGMKIFAEGKRVTAADREASLRFAFQEARVSCVTLGMENNAEIDDAVERVTRNTKA